MFAHLRIRQLVFIALRCSCQLYTPQIPARFEVLLPSRPNPPPCCCICSFHLSPVPSSSSPEHMLQEKKHNSVWKIQFEVTICLAPPRTISHTSISRGKVAARGRSALAAAEPRSCALRCGEHPLWEPPAKAFGELPWVWRGLSFRRHHLRPSDTHA